MFRPAPRALWFGILLTLASLAVAGLVPHFWWIIAAGWLVLLLAMVATVAATAAVAVAEEWCK